MTPTESPSALLRRAADRLEGLASAVPEGPWALGGIGDYGWTVHMGDPASRTFESIDTRMDSEEGRALAAYIATMGPLTALPFAAILRAAADDADVCDRQNSYRPDDYGRTRVMYHPMVVAAIEAARRILGEGR